jgi:hypothetical protein
VYPVILELGAALAKEHVHRNEKLEKGYDEPWRNFICWPEQEECIEHI